jgi:hypothetical protein
MLNQQSVRAYVAVPAVAYPQDWVVAAFAVWVVATSPANARSTATRAASARRHPVALRSGT